MKKVEKNSSAGRTICTRSLAASTPASIEHDTPSLRRSTRGMPTMKPITPASATRKSDKPTPSPASVSKKSGGMDKKSTPSPLRRSDRGKNEVSSQKEIDNCSRDADTSLSIEQRKGIKKNNVKESTNEIKKRKPIMSTRRFTALIDNKSEALVDASNDEKVVIVGSSLYIPASDDDDDDDDVDDDDDDDVQDGNSDCRPPENSESKSLPLEKGTDSVLESMRNTEKLKASPMVETGDGNAIGSPSNNSETQNLIFSKTSLETNIGLPLKRKRDTAEVELDECAFVENGDDRVMSSDGVIPSMRDTEKRNASPMVETGDGNTIGSPLKNSETQNLTFSKTSLETNKGLLLKRKRDTAEFELDECAFVEKGDNRVMSSDGVIPSLSGCKMVDQPETCNTCGKWQKVNSDFENLSSCSCIAQPVKESDHVAQDMVETEPATSRDYDQNMQMQHGKSSDPKLYSSVYTEYWVPVQLSDVQLEQYCRTLFSNSLSLSSLSKNNLGALEETLSSVRKTCDHPYVKDSSFKQLLAKNLELHEFLDVEIRASGKLHLLDAMLTYIKTKGLKAVVFYQATQSHEGLLLGNILEDFVSERFGQNFYEHVIYSSSSKKNAINKFNSESQCCVLLLERRGCSQAIKLLRAEAFILFGSSLNPSLDVKLLEKIKIESCAERTKIFRLYSVCTVEEKSLILAKQNKWQNKENLNRSQMHVLLMWGASYLFDKLDHFRDTETPGSRVPFEQSILDGVMQEFSSILSSKGGEGNGGKLRLLLEAKHDQGNYSSDSTLFGEEHINLSDEDHPNIFWTKLLVGKNPMWKYPSYTPQRNRKRVHNFDGAARIPNLGNVGNTKRQKKASDNSTDLPLANDERKASVKDQMGALGSPKIIALQSSSKSTSGTDDTLDGNDTSGLYSMGVQISGIPEDMLFSHDCTKIPCESQRKLHAVLKSEMTKLGKVLHLSEACTSMVEQFLEYVIDNRRIYEKPATTFPAFQMALSWIAALLVKQKLSHKESLARAKSELGFSCSIVEVNYIYSILSCMKSLFLEHKKGMQFDCCGTTFSQSKIGKNQVDESLSGAAVRQGKNNMESMCSSEGEECMTEKKCSHYNTATRDIEETIRDIKRKCKKKLQKLEQEHDGEKVELLKKYADKKQELETNKKVEAAIIRLTCSRTSTLADDLKRVEHDFERKLYEINSQKTECLQSLDQMHEAAKKKSAEDEACWISRIKNWAQAELKSSIPNKSGKKHVSGICSSNTSQDARDVQTCNDANVEATYADTNCMVSNGKKAPEAESTLGTMSGGSNQQSQKMVSLRNDKPMDVSALSPEQPTDNVATKSQSSKHVSITMPEILIPAGCQDKFAALNEHLSEYQNSDRITSVSPDKDVSSRVPKVFQSLANHAQSASPEVSLNREETLVATESNRTNHVGSEANRETCSLDKEIPDEVRAPIPHPAPVVETRGTAESDQDDQDICPMPSSLAKKQPCPAANTRSQIIQAATEPQSVEPENLETTDSATSSQGHQVTCPLPSSPATNQPVPDANIEAQNINTSAEPLIAGPDVVESGDYAVCDQEMIGAQDAYSLPPTLVGTQPDLGPNIEGQNINTSAEPLIAGPDAVESGDYAVCDQEMMGAQDACSLPPTLVGTQTDLGPDIEGQNINTSAEPLIAGPDTVESGDYAVCDQETMGAQDACSLPPTLVETRSDLRPNIEGQNITAVAQLPSPTDELDGLDAVETGGSPVSDQGAQDASPLPLSSPGNHSNVELNTEGVNNTTVVEPLTTRSDACEMEIAEPGVQVEQSTFANLVHEGGVEPSAGVTSPVPSLFTNGMGHSAVQPVPQIPFPVFSDPFLHELEKLRRESENSKKIYEEKKSILKSELERKMAELQAEFQRKFQEVEAEHNTKSMEIETNKNHVIMNKLLANAFLSKCTEKKTSHSADPRGRIQQLAQRAVQGSALRNYTAPTPTQSPLHPQASSVSRPSGRPLNPAVCPMPQPRQPLISNTTPTLSTPPATNQVANARLRHPAPHLSSYRPSSLTRVSTAPLTSSSSPLTSSPLPQPLTYSGVLSQQQQQQEQQPQPGLSNGLQGKKDLVYLSDDE